MPRSSKPSATLSAISKSERSNSLVSSLASSWGQFAVSIQNLHERRPIVLVLRPRPRKLAFALSTTKARLARSSIVKVTHRRNVMWRQTSRRSRLSAAPSASATRQGGCFSDLAQNSNTPITPRGRTRPTRERRRGRARGRTPYTPPRVKPL